MRAYLDSFTLADMVNRANGLKTEDEGHPARLAPTPLS
jgi:hypothetical protein